MINDWIKPNWPINDAVGALTTTRSGGKSFGVYDSLNLGFHVGDDPNCVETNRKIVANQLSLTNGIIYVNQVHGTDVKRVTSLDVGKNFDVDAIVTSEKELGLAIMTADCLPIMLYSPSNLLIGNAHAGWRGLCNGVIENTIKAMTPNNCVSDLFAFLGPAIGKESFEVGTEVVEQFCSTNKSYSKFFIKNSNDRYLADLVGIAKEKLLSLGINGNHIFGGDFCTYSNPKYFFSYRRDHTTGRMASIIWLK